MYAAVPERVGRRQAERYVERRGVRGHPDEREGERPGRPRVGACLRRQLLHAQRDPALGGGADDAGQRLRVAVRRHAEHLSRGRPRGPGHAAQLLRPAQHVLRVRQQQAAEPGDLDLPPGAVEQLTAELPFERLHPAAEQWLRDAEHVRGAGEAAFLAHRDERL